MDGYWFTSNLFTIEPGENEEVNPGRYGQQLAIWLKTQLEQRGYNVEPVIAEDWGRCLMLSRDPFLLWVGCGNVDDPEVDDPTNAKITWHCSLCERYSSRPNPSISPTSVGEVVRRVWHNSSSDCHLANSIITRLVASCHSFRILISSKRQNHGDPCPENCK